MNSTERKRDLDEMVLDSLPVNLRPAAGRLQHPYIAPGAQYATDLWDWDSYWMIFGILEIAKRNHDDRLRKEVTPYALGSLQNFLDHQGGDGSIPIMICPDDEDPFDCRKDPANNMAKPFFGQLAKLLCDHGLLTGAQLAEVFPKIRRYHDCMEARYLHAGTGLICWGKDWGIGVDDDPTAWGRPPLSSANVFLNAVYLKDCMCMLELAQRANWEPERKLYRERIDRLSRAIETYCWDSRESAYFTLDVQSRQRLTPHRRWKMLNVGLEPFWQGIRLKVLSWSCMLPFWAGLGSEEQFSAFIDANLTPDRLWSDYGVRALSKDEPMYAPEVARGNPSNWLGPVWIVVNYVIWETLIARGHRPLAEKLAHNVRKLLQDDLDATGCLHEYYSPETGKGVMAGGFMSWNLLGCLMK